MNKIIEVTVRELDIKKYEKEIIMEVKPSFLLEASLIATPLNGVKNEVLVYSFQDHIPVAEVMCGLNDAYNIIKKYVNVLLAARNMLLNVENISSDPKEIFISEKNELKIIYSNSYTKDEIEKVCDLIRFFSSWDDVVGAKSSMKVLLDRISGKNLSLKTCLKLIEAVQREWNHIN